LRRRYRRWQRRRLALAELARLRAALGQECHSSRFAAGVSILLRRLALARYPRPYVAGLSGEHWLQFLDRTGGGGGFTIGPGRALATAPYCLEAKLHADALYALAVEWIKHNA
jgi:hypothetical protein